MHVLLGIDAGGTKTRAILVDEQGGLVGYGESSAGNPNNVGAAKACQAYLEACQRAWENAGRSRGEVACAYLACAGIKTDDDADEMKTQAISLGLAEPEKLFVGNDLEAALAGALASKPGIALVAGTGSFCLGRDATGKMTHCGGWGWILDDVGSASWLGIQGIRAAVRSSDGRAEKTSLLGIAMQRYDASTPDALQQAVYAREQPRDLASFASELIAAASAGDEASLSILKEGATGLAQLVSSVAARLSWQSGPKVVLCGSAARGGPPYQPMIEAAISQATPGALIKDPILSPVAGAALLAIEKANIPLTDTILKNLSLAESALR